MGLLSEFSGVGGGSIGRASVDLVLNSTAYNAQLAEAEGKTKAATGGLSKAFTDVRSSLTPVGVAAVGVAAIAGAAITKAISTTQEWTAEIRGLQRVTGQSAEDASRLAAAATDLGIPVDKLNVAFGILSKNIVNGSANFDKYGIATKDASGATLPFNTILGELSDKFNTLPAGPEQAAFAMNVFGRSGKDLIPILSRGSEGLQELYDSAQAAGLVMSQDALDASKRLAIAQRELGEAVKGAEVHLVSGLLPALTSVVTEGTKFVELFQKVPTPVIQATLGFIAFNAILTVARATVGFLSRTLIANAVALGQNADAAVADSIAQTTDTDITVEHSTAVATDTKFLLGRKVAAGEDAVAMTTNATAVGKASIVTRGLNSSLVASIAPMYGLYKATQFAVAEFEHLKAGNFPGAFNDVASAMSFFTGASVPKMNTNLQDANTAFQDLQTQMQDGLVTQDEAITKAQQIADQYGINLTGGAAAFVDSMGPIPPALDAVTGGLDATGLAADGAATGLDAQATAAQKALDAAVRSAGAHKINASSLRDVESAATRAASASDTYTSSIEAQNQALRDVARAQQAARLAQLQAAGGLLGLVSSLKQTQDDQATLNRLQREGKTNTQAYRDAVVTATTDQLAFRQAVRQYVQDNPNRSLAATKQALREMAAQAGISGHDFKAALGDALDTVGGKVDNLQHKWKAFKDDVSRGVQVNVNTTGALANVETLRKALSRVT